MIRKLVTLYLALLFLSSTFSWPQGQPGEEGPPYYGLELPPYGSGLEAFEAFEKEVEERKRSQPGYSPPPYENALRVIKHGPSFHEGVVLSYNDQSIKELKELIFEFDNSKYRGAGGSAIQALGIIHSVDPDAVSFDELAYLVTEIEYANSISEGRKVDILSGGYRGISYSKDPKAYDFLIKRVTGEMWADGEIPTTRYYTTHGPNDDEGFIATAQSDAIRALSGVNDPRIPAILEKLREETPDDKDHIHYAIPSGYYGERDRRFEELREAAYAKRLKALGLQAKVNAVSSAEAVVEISPPEVTKEETPEIVTAEPSEELVEKSSNWWLWLVGVVIVVGALLRLRQKK